MLSIIIILSIICILQIVNVVLHLRNPYTKQMQTIIELIKAQVTTVLLENQQKMNDTIKQLEQNLHHSSSIAKDKIIETLGSNNENNLSISAKNTADIIKTLNNHNETTLIKFNHLNNDIKTNLNTDISKLIETVRLELDKINMKVEDKLKHGFEQSTQTFQSILQRLTKIDEAQKQIENLSMDIVSLQNVLTDKKTRGIFGEIQLNQILTAAFGENNKKIYKTQYKLNNGNIADAILFTPEPLGNIVIDAKFPLENYKKMVDVSLSVEERKLATREFENNVKRMIDTIATKYITEETSQQAIMFIPAEAVFAQIHAYHETLIDYSVKKQVWFASPTTLMASLTTIQVIIKNMEQAKHAKTIQEQLHLLAKEFGRYRERWDKLSQHIDTVSKDVKEIHTTTNKIGDKFESIAQVDIMPKINSTNEYGNKFIQ